MKLVLQYRILHSDKGYTAKKNSEDFEDFT